MKLSEQCRLQQRDMEVLVEQAVYDEETPQFDPWTSEQGEISDDVNTSCVIKAPETAHSGIQHTMPTVCTTGEPHGTAHVECELICSAAFGPDLGLALS